jgi:superfamily II DNA or RNA helicase
MIKAEYAGCGKSYACKYMENLGYKVLFVCPTNKLVQNNKDNGITLNKFFSIGLTEDTKLKKFDDSDYDVIVFDEIYFANVYLLTRIKNYIDNNPDK